MGYNFKISQNNLKKKHKKNDYFILELIFLLPLVK